METLQQIINTANDVLWTYILIAMLLGCAVYFTWRTRFVQFRNLREMLRLLTEGAPKSTDGQRQVSSFQAFAVSIASRVGTGNLAGVATAIAVGGAGAVFWMWIIALLGSVNAFVESTLAQLYKRKDNILIHFCCDKSRRNFGNLISNLLCHYRIFIGNSNFKQT